MRNTVPPPATLKTDDPSATAILLAAIYRSFPAKQHGTDTTHRAEERNLRVLDSCTWADLRQRMAARVDRRTRSSVTMASVTSKTPRERLGAYGDFWLRYLNWGVRNSLWYIDPILVAIYGTAFFLVCGTMRRGIMANMQVLFPKESRFKHFLRAYCVFWNFAAIAVDSVRCRIDPDVIEWEITGTDHFDTLKGCEGGAIIATAHMGNYDLAGTAFASSFGRIIHAVRAPERTQHLQEVKKQQLSQGQKVGFHVLYNEPGNMLGVTLAQAINRGDLVAIQADRVLFDVSGITVPWDDIYQIQLPRGPFVLSQMTKCPIFPLFILRLGRCKYRIEVYEPFHCRHEDRDRRAMLLEAAEAWRDILAPTIRRYWYQWLIVEPAFTRKP